MNRSIFQIIQITIFIIIVFLNFNTVFCVPKEFMSIGELNDRPFFYYGDIKQMSFEYDLNILLNNYSDVSLEFVNYLQSNGLPFHKNDPKSHFNLILNLKNHYLNYYYSFPFSHYQPNIYYEFLSFSDIKGGLCEQYWRNYIGIHDKKLVKINKLNINSNEYVSNMDLKFKIFNYIKMYKYLK